MYPHKLYSVPVTSSRNSDGYVVSSEGAKSFLGNCRFEPNGKERETRLPDGSYTTCGGVIYAPTTVVAASTGDIVQVEDAYGNVVFKGAVVTFVKSQLHARIWV